jgi:hypothetical protein
MSSAVANTTSERGYAPLDGLPARPGHSLLGERPGPGRTPDWNRTFTAMSPGRPLGSGTRSREGALGRTLLYGPAVIIVNVALTQKE